MTFHRPARAVRWCSALSLLIASSVAGQELAEPPAAEEPPPAATSRTATPRRVRDTLPNEHGQVWREYDISSYTRRVQSTSHPEQAIVDWILRETGTEVWFSEPLGILSATAHTLRVYHTPEMQSLVSDLVDRFLANDSDQFLLGLQLVTVGNPNWRSRSLPLLKPVTVQSPGIDAWLLSRENAALVLAELRKRTDFRDYSTPELLIHNGQSHTTSRLRPRTYARSVRLRDNGLLGYELETGQIEEGFSLQVSPLYALDGRTIDVVVRCHIDQIEKLIPVPLDVPAVGGARQTLQIQVPQMVSWRLHERFRWPADEVLLLSCGVVATPSGERTSPLPFPFTGSSNRADALLFIESRGRAPQNPAAQQSQNPGVSRGRY